MANGLATTEAVIDALGGLPAVMELTGSTYKAAFNWKSAPTFPAKTYVVMIEALKRAGKSASPSLWGMTESVEATQ